ncbi:hypothetical protein IF1G_06149 [Cordyceps javanica]|uniref:Uncharacterized protein n=1 Tax=Cordyceps javanica TaxID=43265 RepID=A0A545V0C2_9HYPO|nr:hypothetical protein IF1G_06149 [Cordyceps javanica]
MRLNGLVVLIDAAWNAQRRWATSLGSEPSDQLVLYIIFPTSAKPGPSRGTKSPPLRAREYVGSHPLGWRGIRAMAVTKQPPVSIILVHGTSHFGRRRAIQDAEVGGGKLGGKRHAQFKFRRRNSHAAFSRQELVLGTSSEQTTGMPPFLDNLASFLFIMSIIFLVRGKSVLDTCAILYLAQPRMQVRFHPESLGGASWNAKSRHILGGLADNYSTWIHCLYRKLEFISIVGHCTCMFPMTCKEKKASFMCAKYCRVSVVRGVRIRSEPLLQHTTQKRITFSCSRPFYLSRFPGRLVSKNSYTDGDENPQVSRPPPPPLLAYGPSKRHCAASPLNATPLRDTGL